MKRKVLLPEKLKDIKSVVFGQHGALEPPKGDGV
jgi:hypothetical protein